MEPIVVGGLLILIFVAWDAWQNWKITHPPNSESATVGRSDALNQSTAKKMTSPRIPRS